MQIETSASNAITNRLSLKLSSLQPKRRATNQAKFAENYDGILDAVNRGVSTKAIRIAMAEEGVTMSSVTFKKLLEAERMRRDACSNEESDFHLSNANQTEKAHG